MGLTDRQLLVARRAAARAARRSSPACAWPPTTTVGLAALAFIAGGGGLGREDPHRHQLQVEHRVARCSCVALGLRPRGCCCSALERLATPLAEGARVIDALELPDRVARVASAAACASAAPSCCPSWAATCSITARGDPDRLRSSRSRRRSGWPSAARASSRPRRWPTSGARCRRSRCSSFFGAYLGYDQGNLVFALVLLALPPIFTNAYVGDPPGRPRRRSTPPAAWA